MWIRACLGLALLSSLSGCFLVHGREDPAALVDAGPTARDAAPFLPACRPARADVACASHDALPELAAGTPTSLAIRLDDCHCGGELRCDVTSVVPASGAGAGSIDLDVLVCGEGDCRACTGPDEVTCAIPALTEGRYRISVRGEPLFQIPASSGLGSDPSEALCQTRGSSGGGLCSFPGDVAPIERASVCFPSATPPGTVTFAVQVPSTPCAYEPGPCDGIVSIDRGGRAISLVPRIRNCDEGAPTWGCSGGSGTLEHRCVIPDLGEGTYGVYVAGVQAGVIRIDADLATAPDCHEVDTRLDL